MIKSDNISDITEGIHVRLLWNVRCYSPLFFQSSYKHNHLLVLLSLHLQQLLLFQRTSTNQAHHWGSFIHFHCYHFYFNQAIYTIHRYRILSVKEVGVPPCNNSAARISEQVNLKTKLFTTKDFWQQALSVFLDFSSMCVPEQKWLDKRTNKDQSDWSVQQAFNWAQAYCLLFLFSLIQMRGWLTPKTTAVAKQKIVHFSCK